jgi:hypothetical protein
VGAYAPTATLLGNGKVLIAGGVDSSHISLARAELYDPGAGAFVPTGSMAKARYAHTATLLGNGKVLIAGGCDAGTSLTHAELSAELYDPSTGTFAPAGDMTVARYEHTATLLGNGKVLIAGGHDRGGANVVGGEVSSAELYDPEAGTFTATASMTRVRASHTATLLGDGKVLIAGGSESVARAGAELYDPAADAFAATGSMAEAREGHTATLLGNGKVLTAGGWGSGTFPDPELYYPVAGAFAITGRMNTKRYCHTATLLPSGKVLVAGGISNPTILASAELYSE